MYLDRPILTAIDQHILEREATVQVTLFADGREYVGEATGDSEAPHRTRLVAEATLRAIELITAPGKSFDLVAVGSSDMGGFKVALAQIRQDANTELIGSALVREGDPASATAKAVLDALNRRLSRVP
jgi:hypothetical protein